MGSDANTLPTSLTIVNIILFFGFFFSEVFGVISSFKYFQAASYKKQISLIVFCVSTHLLFILRIIFCINGWIIDSNKDWGLPIEKITIIPKDAFILTLGWRILEAVTAWDSLNKNAEKLIIVLKYTLYVHTGLSIIFITIWIIDDDRRYYFFEIYFGVVELFIEVIYIYACVKSITFWRKTNNDVKISGYLRWLFILMIYMIPVVVIRICLNIADSFKFQRDFETSSDKGYAAYRFFFMLLIEMIPGNLINLTLYKMINEYLSEGFVSESGLSTH